MGEKTISTQVKINGDITPDFSRDWEVEFQGEKYIMPLRQPQGAKENTSLNSTIDLTFQHWAIYQLKRWMFFTVQPVETGTAVADKYIADVILNLGDFCNLFGQVLRHYYGDTITIDLNPDWDYKQEASPIAISHSYIWDVLIKLYELFAVRWSIEPNGDSSHYVIKVGYPAEELDHIFEYGFEGGLLKVERQVQSEDIRNMLLGRGGEKNIPKYYFKKSPDEEKWRSDPDWIEELTNIYFTNLMSATFRSYIQGWKAAHISKYPGYAAVGESNAYAPWAYRKGYTDSKFDPVEYVKDDESIAKYGPLLGGLDNNEEIYPSIQGSGMDVAVDVEQIESDDVEEATDNDATLSNVGSARGTAGNVAKSAYKTLTIRGANFTVPTGKTANFIDDAKILSVVIPGSGGGRGTHSRPQDIATSAELTSKTINIYNAVTGAKKSASGIPAGSWYYEIVAEVHNLTTDKTLNITVGTETPKLQSATLDNDSWKNTFDIWVKNIWETSKLSTETNEEYAERVWKPILGDREQNTAKVMFTTGALAISEDYEFTIVDFPKLDTSKSLNGESSHWRIKLAKSDADLESTGLYVPSTQKQGKAGDKFVFIGTEMTHHYVVWAETALDDWKKDQLREKKDIKPTWVVTTDRVRLNNEGKANALIQQLRIGNSLRLADKRFIQPIEDRAYETLYLQSITYTYREPSSDDAALNPDVAIVLLNEYATTANPVATMQGEISALQRQMGSISNVEQIVRAVGDKLYLRKDGISDRSLSPTQFFSLLTSGDFRSGIIGGAGWGFFKDENGNWVLEADRVNVRQEMQVNTLVINQAEGRGGMEIDTAAFMEVTRVVETSDGYVCYFDQKEGSVANLFHIDDVAYCNKWTPENTELKFYKRRVIAVGVDNITLTKGFAEVDRPEDWPDSGVNGSGIPTEKDNIIHFGNYTDKRRQYVKVRDVVGGGYERYIEELNSVNAAGVEYYFVGKQAGESRWFVGNKDLVPYSGKGDGSYIEYINRRFNLNNVTLSVNTTIGDQSLADYIQQVSPPVKQEDIEGFVDAIVDPKLGEIQDQIDGVIETWFANGVPTLTSYPASGWNTDALKIQHLGDLYYDNDTGTAYRFSQNAQGGYYWNTITDDAITKALAAAKAAQDTADGKRRVFTSQPVPPYDEGDLWVNATYPANTTAATRDPYNSRYYFDILRCGASKTSGSFAISDWGLASNYTDDTKANEALSSIRTYEYIKNALAQDTQISGGLMMTTLISLGYTDDGNMRHTLAGMNGSWIPELGGRTIASWYGGEMIDLFDTHDNRLSPTPPNGATSLIRMDGSAYWANGNIGFRADGSGWLGNDTNGIKFGRDGSMIFGNGIKINLSSGEEGLADTLESVLNLMTNLSVLLKPVDAQGNELQWTQINSVHALKSTVHFLSVGDVTAYAAGGIGGGSGFGGSLGDLSDVQLGSLAAGDVIKWDGQHWVNGPAPAGGVDESVLANYVTLDTEQEIRGHKKFTHNDTDFSYRITINGSFESDIHHHPQVMWHVSNRRWTKAVMDTWGNIHLLEGSAGTFDGAHQGLIASKFAKPDGTASQVLMADGSVQTLWRAAEVTTATRDDGMITPLGLNQWTSANFYKKTDADARFVNVTGDTMTGPLTVPHNGFIVGSDGGDSTQRVIKAYGGNYAQNTYYINFGFAPSVANCGELAYKYIEAGSVNNFIGMGFYGGRYLKYTYGGVLTVGSDAGGWNTVWHAGNHGSGSGLHADLLDGLHGHDYVGYRGLISSIGVLPATAGMYQIATAGWNGGAVVFNCAGSNSGLAFYRPGGSNSMPQILCALDSTNNWDNFGSIVTSRFGNAPSATKLQTARTLRTTSYNNYRASDGVSFDGTGDVTLKLPNSICASDWFRSYGSSGWYNQDYAGGIYMTDSTWVRIYNNKGFYSGTGEIRSDARFNRMGYGGDLWNKGYGAYNVAIRNNASQTPLLLAYRDSAGLEATGANRLFAIELLNNGVELKFGFGGTTRFTFNSGGHLVTSGDVTAYSDARLKSDVQTLRNRGFIIPRTYIKDGKRCIGFLAQEVRQLYPELVTDTGGADHWLALNYGNLVAVLEAQIIDHEERIKRLEAKI